MKACIGVAITAMVLGFVFAAVDWKLVESELTGLSKKLEDIFRDIGSAVSADNEAVGKKVSPTLEKHKNMAIHEITECSNAANAQTLTEASLKESETKVREILKDLRAAVAEELKQLSEDGRVKIRKICEREKAAFREKVDEIVELLRK